MSNKSYILSFLLLCVILGATAPSNLPAQRVRWIQGISKVDALRRGRLLLFFFYLPGNRFSDRMDWEVWNQPPIVAQTKKFICIRRDGGSRMRDDFPSTISSLRIDYLPTTVITDPMGNVFFQGDLFMSPDELLTVMRSLPDSLPETFRVLERLNRDPGDASLLMEAGEAYRKVRVPEISNAYFARALENNDLQLDTIRSERARYGMAENYFLLKNLSRSEELFEELLDRNPRSTTRPRYLYRLVEINRMTLNETRAIGYLQILRKEFPDSPELKTAESLLRQ